MSQSSMILFERQVLYKSDKIPVDFLLLSWRPINYPQPRVSMDETILVSMMDLLFVQVNVLLYIL